MKVPECLKGEEITPMSKDEAREWFRQLWLKCPDFAELPLPSFVLAENENIATERKLKPGVIQFMTETFKFYESIQHLTDEEKLEKIRERNESMGVFAKRKAKPSGNLMLLK